MNNYLPDPAGVGMSAERLARIKPAMLHYVERCGFAGISTLVARRGQIVHFEQVGHQDREAGTPLTAETLYRIYSMTKPIICTALMILHEEGRFHLFDPVAKFLPAFGKVRVLSDGHLVDPVRPMTIHQLFTHTAGLTYNFLEDSPVCNMYLEAGLMANAHDTLEQCIAELARFPLAYHPGERWHYSMSIDVLAHLIEVLADQPLRDFLHQRLFQPLGMNDTGFTVPSAKLNRLSAMYGHPDIATHNFSHFMAAWQAGDNGRRAVDDTYPADDAPNFARGGHGLFTTIGDYWRFAQMLLNQGHLDGVRVLGRKTVELMHSNHLPASMLPYGVGVIPFSGYGFGLGSRVLLNVAESALTGSAGEFGWAGAAQTYFWVDPQEQLVGVLMSQYMMCFDQPQNDLQVLAYQAIVD